MKKIVKDDKLYARSINPNATQTTLFSKILFDDLEVARTKFLEKKKFLETQTWPERVKREDNLSNNYNDIKFYE